MSTSSLIYYMPALIITILIIVGAFLLFNKSKKHPDSRDPEAWVKQLKISPAAREIRLKEMKRETGGLLSKQWFLEYWHGKRSLVNAVIVWCVAAWALINIFLLIVMAVTSTFFGEKVMVSLATIFNRNYALGQLTYSELSFAFLLLFFSCAYSFVTAIIIWRCSNNSTRLGSLLGKILSLLYFLRILFIVNI